jgi:hypothetical protein
LRVSALPQSRFLSHVRGALPRPVFGLDLLLEESCKRRADAHKDQAPEHCDDDGQRDTAWRHQDVKQQNVYNDRREQSQRERYIPTKPAIIGIAAPASQLSPAAEKFWQCAKQAALALS